MGPVAAEVTIRAARPDDLAALLDLYVHLNPNNAALPDEARVRQAWGQLLRGEGGVTCFVAEAEGRLVGSCVLAVIPNLTHGARPFGVMENVVTHRDCRGRGVGSRLVRHVLRLAWGQGCYKVMLLSGAWREEAHRFYERLGFRREDKVGFVATPETAPA
jgi:GNAT superfamily N-acetyltransferase